MPRLRKSLLNLEAHQSAWFGLAVPAAIGERNGAKPLSPLSRRGGAQFHGVAHWGGTWQEYGNRLSGIAWHSLALHYQSLPGQNSQGVQGNTRVC